MMEANLDSLQNTMQELEERRDDVLRRVVREEDKGLQRLAQVQGWVSRVEGVGSQVNDLLKARSSQTKGLCLCGYCSKKFISGCNYGKRVLKKLNQVEGLLAKGVFEVVAAKIPPLKVEKKHIQTTFGLDSMVERAWSCFMTDGRRSLGLYGMGGVGKTTLLAHINNKFLEMVNNIDVVIWVVVSKDLQNEDIQEQILRRLGLDKEWKQESEKEKASDIYNILNKKKFVLLLDDLWSEVDQIKIGVPPVSQENGSKIVFTTRSKEVCKNMEVDGEMEVACLSPEDSWELFQTKVGEIPFKSHQDIPILARKVVEKCCGLPLALNVIGRVMGCKTVVQEWHHAVNVLNSSSQEFPGMEEKILSILRFSYDNLKDEKVKLCFLYCALFPEDYQLVKEELIEFWICEGFIDGNRDGDGPNYQGHDIIGLLVSAHLLMDGEYSTRVKMHDVIREMALWIASNFGKEKEKICVKSGAQLLQIPDGVNWENVRRMSLMSNRFAEISCSPNCPNLSTLLLRKNKLEDISGEFFQLMPALVVLDLSQNKRLIGLPEEICNLISLHYLNLSHTRIKRLPVGLKELKKLTDLNLEFCHELQTIAGIPTSLPNLQVLKLFYSRICIDDKLLEELQVLKHLKVLTATIKDVLIMEKIQGGRLARSTRALCLRNMSEHVVKLNTVALSGLQRLGIVNCKNFEIEIDWKTKDKGSQLNILPCTNSPGFKHLVAVDIVNMEGPRDLTWLLFAQNLRDLFVVRSSSIEEIINKEKGESISNVHPDIGIPFQKLEFLKVSRLYELKRICWTPPVLPNLREFVVGNCPKLSNSATEFPGHVEE